MFISYYIQDLDGDIGIIQREFRKHEADRGNDETNMVVVYPEQQRVLKGTMISNEVLAQIVSSKYLDHMLLNRQEQDFPRMGLSISRQSMKNWIYMVARRCGPLIELLKTLLLECDLINMDETPHRRLIPAMRTGL